MRRFGQSISRVRPDDRSGFTLIEILIVVVILGILAAVVIPQFSNASHVARENTAKDDLRYLRTQIAVYKAQHRDIPPGMVGSPSGVASEATFLAQMTGYTDDVGNVGASSSTYKFGPYLSRMPANPINGRSNILVIQNNQPLPTAASGQYGWVYHPKTQAILSDAAGTDKNGARYFDY